VPPPEQERVAAALGRHFAADLVRPFGEETDRLCGVAQIPGVDLVDGPRRSQRLQRGQRLCIRLDQVGPAAQHLHPPARVGLRPAAFLIGGLRIFDRFGQLPLVHAVQFRLHPAIGRTTHGDRLPAPLDPAAADEIMRLCQTDKVGVETVHGIISCYASPT